MSQEKSKYKKFNDNVARESLTPGASYRTPEGTLVVAIGRHGRKWRAVDASRRYGCYWPSELVKVAL